MEVSSKSESVVYVQKNRWTRSVHIAVHALCALVIIALVLVILVISVPGAKESSSGSSSSDSGGGVNEGEGGGQGLSPSTPKPSMRDGRLDFIAIGDWGVEQTGSEDSENKTMTAEALRVELEQMATTPQSFDAKFIIGTGDNFYPNGLVPGDDTLFYEAFAEPYAFTPLPWFNVLGNHDYESIAIAEEWGERLRGLDARWTCHREYSILKTVSALDGAEPFTVHFFFIDTTPLIEKYHKRINKCLDTALPADQDGCDAGNNGLKVIEPAMEIKLRSAANGGAIPEEEKMQVWKTFREQQALKLRELLQHSDARWKIVVGHHGIYSQGDDGDFDDLKRTFLSMLKENGVHVYLNGHDHTLQHIKFDAHPTHFITTGSGAKVDEGMPRSFKERPPQRCMPDSFPEICDSPTMDFFTNANGFTKMSISRDEIYVAHVAVIDTKTGESGEIVHEHTIPYEA